MSGTARRLQYAIEAACQALDVPPDERRRHIEARIDEMRRGGSSPKNDPVTAEAMRLWAWRVRGELEEMRRPPA